MLFLTRRYRFSASHRLHNDALSAEENAHLYGKCNSPYGHGHNYAVEVTVCGPVDPATGMVFDLAALDRIVEKEILEPLDHSYLNVNVEGFGTKVPTTENVCIEIFNRIRDKLENGSGSARLGKVRLEETRSNFFEYVGESLQQPEPGMRGKR
jgi:6-pyruvoyltetrahydropterin/6-carboxytetrahydropterin synthase